MNLFEKDETNTLDIPDFVEDKDTTESTSVDMSIFKMSDEELYDDEPKKKVKDTNSDIELTSKKKSNSTIILCLVLIGVLLVTAGVSVIYAYKEHSTNVELQAQVSQLTAQNKDLQNNISTLNGQIAELNAKIESNNNAGTNTDPNKKYAKGSQYKINEDGQGTGIHVSADKNSDMISGSKTYYDWGDVVTLLADATVDSDGSYWAKSDIGYFKIEVDGEPWADIVE